MDERIGNLSWVSAEVCSASDCRFAIVPFQVDAARRRSAPAGSLAVWFTEEVIATRQAEPRTTPGGQPHYSALATRTALTLRTVFRLALRQSEGLIGSVLRSPWARPGRAGSRDPAPAR